MSTLLALMLLAVVPSPPLAESYPDAVEVYRADFAPSERHGYGAWPRDWQHKTGPGYPPYVRGTVRPETSRAGNYCLRFDLDGGAAAATSAPIEADDRHSYVLEGYIKTDKLVHDCARLSLAFLDERGKVLETIDSLGVVDHEWRKVRIGPLAPRSSRARFAVLGVSLEPAEAAGPADLFGTAMFAGVTLSRLPRLSVTLDGDGAFYATEQPLVVTARLTGFDGPLGALELEVLDARGNSVPESRRALELDSGAAARSTPESGGRAAQEIVARWNGSFDTAGYYRLRVGYRGLSGTPHQIERPLAIVEVGDPPPPVEFGWTLPDGAGSLTYHRLADLLRQAGVGQVKMPVWSEAGDAEAMLALADFAGLLTQREIGLIAVLDRPPPEVCKENQLPSRPSLAEVIFSPAETWQASLTAPLLHLGLQSQAWQAGGDRDTSLVDSGDPVPLVEELRKPFDKLLPEGTLIVPARADNPPIADPAPWQIVSIAPPTGAIGSSVERRVTTSIGSAFAAQRWPSFDPLPADRPLDQRVGDLVRQMVDARVRGVPALFLYDPQACGVVESDGSPGELLLPWRTTALALSGAEYLGQLTLPGGSENHVFARGGQITMVVRNDRPTRETLYLGDDVWQTSVWGRTTEVARADDRHELRVGPLPTFVHGLSSPATRFSLLVQLARPRLPSWLGQRQANAVRVTNTFETRLEGQLKIVSPSGWRTRPDTFEVQLAPGETVEIPFESFIPLNAMTGVDSMQFDFQVSAGRPLHLTVYRNIELGDDEIELALAARLTADGSLVVDQRLINNTDDPVAFRCLLFAPGRIRQRHDVHNLSRGDERYQYVLADATELAGQTLWVRAEEIGGERVLNYRVVVEDTPSAPVPATTASQRSF